MDVVLALLLGENLLEWGGGLEEGGKTSDPIGGRRIYFQCFLGVFFECVFRGVTKGVFFDFGCLWVSLWGSLLTPFCEKLRFFWKRWYPRFGTTVQRFGLILGVLSPSEAIQIRKKGSRNSFEI